MQIQHQIGEVIANRYEITEILGKGGIGITYSAKDLKTEQQVALKVLFLKGLDDWKKVELFEREAKVLAKLEHKSIPKYLDYFCLDNKDDRSFYIVQELAPGKSLFQLIEDGWRTSEEEIKSIASQVLSILDYLHTLVPPVIHRDINPQNIIRSDDGKILLVDFGAVQNTYYKTVAKGSTVVGTYGYMAPEQFRGKAFPSTDLYGLGTTVLYLLTHKSPSELPHKNLKINFRNSVKTSKSLANWLDKMLEPDTEKRFESAKESLENLSGNSFSFGTQWLKNILPSQESFQDNLALQTLVVIVGMGILSVLALPELQVSKKENKTSDRYDTSVLCKNPELTQFYLEDGGDPNISVVDRYGNTSLLFCYINKRDLVTTEKLIKKGANLNLKDRQGNTPLLTVLSKKNYGDRGLDSDTIARLLIARGSDIKAKNNRGFTPLVAALSNNYPNIARLLVQKNADYNVDFSDRSNNPLHLAISKGYRDVAKLLITKNKDLINIPNSQKQTPLFAAVAKSDRELIELLISKGANIHHVDRKGRSVLFEAVQRSNLEIVQFLVSKGINLELKDNRNQNALFPAISNYKNSTPIVNFLINSGINTRQKDSQNNTPLIVASSRNNLSAVKLLISRGSDVNAISDRGITPLLGFINSVRNYRGNHSYSLEIAKTLIDKGANVDRVSSNFNSKAPLEAAIDKNNLDLVKLLLDRGANVNSLQDKKQNSILNYALNRNLNINPEIIKLLIAKGGDINAKNSQGNTPLLSLLSKTSYSNTSKYSSQTQALVKLLVSNGANVNIKDIKNRTPLTLAMFYGDRGIIDLLKKYGAKYE